MNNSDILLAVAVVAVMALGVRVILQRETRRGGGIDWWKIVMLVVVVSTFIGVYVIFDPYRVDTWRDGAATAADCRQGYVVGRQAGDGVAVMDSLPRTGLPMYFAMRADSINETGYWRRKSAGMGDETAEREVMHDKQDESRIAIKRTTRNFDVTRHPANEKEYIRIYRIALPSGQKVLATLPDYEAEQEVTPIMTAQRLSGLMSEVASRDSMTNTDVYMQGYDAMRVSDGSAVYILYKVFAGLTGVVIVVILGGIIRATRKRWNRKEK